MNIFRVGLLVGALGCCGFGINPPNSPERIVLREKDLGLGVVVLSTREPRSCLGDSLSLGILPIDEEFRSWSMKSALMGPGLFAPDFEDRSMVRVFKLKPGVYQAHIRSMRLEPADRRYPQMRFEVAAGERIYIGNFVTQTDCTGYPQLVVRDMFERDTRSAKERSASLRDAVFVNRVGVIGIP